MRFTSQPIEEPDEARQAMQLFEVIKAKKTLMFSSDHSHGDYDYPLRSFPRLSEEVAKRIFDRNAAELYGSCDLHDDTPLVTTFDDYRQ